MTDLETRHVGPTREEVRLAYVMLLGREPESEAVVDAQAAAARDLPTLIASIRASSEFRDQNGASGKAEFMTEVASGYWSPPSQIAYDVAGELSDRLAARIRSQWTKLGEEEPYWSVLTDEQFRADVLDRKAKAAFHRTGRDAASLIDLASARTGRSSPAGVCVELGCGVGRITRFLADRFERVLAVDISPGNLAMCTHHMASEGVTNVDTMLIKQIDDLRGLPNVDYFFSMIVLQHNPPPIQYQMLSILFDKLKPGGEALFQTVADLPGYSFDPESYLQTPSPVMEIHSLPMVAILSLMREKGLVLDTARMDPWVDAYGSYTFTAHRPISAERSAFSLQAGRNA